MEPLYAGGGGNAGGKALADLIFSVAVAVGERPSFLLEADMRTVRLFTEQAIRIAEENEKAVARRR